MDNQVPRNYDMYFYTKCIWAIAYCNNCENMINNLFSSFKINYDSFYDMLDIFLGYNYDCIDESSKNNLSYLINYLYRYSNGSNKQGLHNKFCAILNRCNTSRIKGLVLTEYELRYMYDDVPRSIVSDNNIYKYFSMLKNLYVNDLDILISHLYSDNDIFEECVDSYLHDSLNYIGSINKIVSDCPDIVRNVAFASRIHRVCNAMENSIGDSYVKKIYNDFRKKLN